MRNVFDGYRDYVTACLSLGPLPRRQLDIPEAALRALQKAGIIRPRIHSSGTVATQWWYLSRDLAVTPPPVLGPPLALPTSLK